MVQKKGKVTIRFERGLHSHKEVARWILYSKTLQSALSAVFILTRREFMKQKTEQVSIRFERGLHSHLKDRAGRASITVSIRFERGLHSHQKTEQHIQRMRGRFNPL